MAAIPVVMPLVGLGPGLAVLGVGGLVYGGLSWYIYKKKKEEEENEKRGLQRQLGECLATKGELQKQLDECWKAKPKLKVELELKEKLILELKLKIKVQLEIEIKIRRELEECNVTKVKLQRELEECRKEKVELQSKLEAGKVKKDELQRAFMMLGVYWQRQLEERGCVLAEANEEATEAYDAEKALDAKIMVRLRK